RPNQPLTACLDGSVGKAIVQLNQMKSDVITFHCYEGFKLKSAIEKHLKLNRPVICTEYMAREFGTTFEFSLPIFKNYRVGCYNWGLVAGKSQTHFGWSTIADLQKLKKGGKFLNSGDPIPEPEKWFHDIFRVDGSAYDDGEVSFIKMITKQT
ncbi:MAG: 1,4-beta-xylanase, partial [Gammaproteobacteria bacterium]|nr:1,4-beta-xylanase [Gammaproteobacteria bacterium]